jgi:DnaK suppressor protein
MALKMALTEAGGVQEILELSEAELVEVLRKRAGIAIEKSADQMDEVQSASERDLAIRNVDRETRLLLQGRAALQRIRDGSFGTCIECESAISPKTSRRCAMGAVLHPVPGSCRPGWVGENGLGERDSR